MQATYAQNGEVRSVPMHDVLTATLKAIRINATVDGSVFCNRNGIPCQLFCSRFETAVQKAWLADFTFHDLRPTFASRLVMSGVALPTVKELLGYKDINMTLRYTHFSMYHKQHVVCLLERFGGKVPAIFATRIQAYHRERP